CGLLVVSTLARNEVREQVDDGSRDVLCECGLRQIRDISEDDEEVEAQSSGIHTVGSVSTLARDEVGEQVDDGGRDVLCECRLRQTRDISEDDEEVEAQSSGIHTVGSVSTLARDEVGEQVDDGGRDVLCKCRLRQTRDISEDDEEVETQSSGIHTVGSVLTETKWGNRLTTSGGNSVFRDEVREQDDDGGRDVLCECRLRQTRDISEDYNNVEAQSSGLHTVGTVSTLARDEVGEQVDDGGRDVLCECRLRQTRDISEDVEEVESVDHLRWKLFHSVGSVSTLARDEVGEQVDDGGRDVLCECRLRQTRDISEDDEEVESVDYFRWKLSLARTPADKKKNT
ncbi:hypothetical protein J6590_107341, partial [Homalodisca vitripennis]